MNSLRFAFFNEINAMMTLASEYSVTSPLGKLVSRDTSVQGRQNVVPEKCSHNLRILLPLLKDSSIQAKGTLFWNPKPRFNLHSGDTLAIKK